jgi:hypothetical protein
MRKNPALLVSSLVVIAASGCSGERSENFRPQTLTRVTEAGADEMCVRGGVVIETGLDDNENGVLDDAEVVTEETLVVCEGESSAPGEPPAQHAVLTRTVALPVGSEDCRYGGRRVEAGIDDGAGAGTPDDDVLADDEVDTTYLDCNATPPAPVDVITPPEGDPGTAVIELPGGSAPTGQAGGYGGYFAGENYDAEQCIPELTRIFPTGSVDASFTLPEIAVDLGAVPLVVMATGTLKTSADSLTDGEFFYDAGSGTVRRWDAGAPGAFATGMRVASNVTFVIPNGAVISFANDVEILGTIKNSANEVRSLNLAARNFVVGTTGRIEVLQEQASNGLRLSAEGHMVLRGKLSVNGETSGAAGGPVNLSARGRVFLAGTIDASGADSTNNGGTGGTVLVTAGTGGVWSSASIDASGGEGSFVGGAGGQITLGVQSRFEHQNATLDLRNSGALNVSGGPQTACSDAICSGGTGGVIELVALGASLRSSGDLRASGGDSEATAGSGGTIRLAVLAGRDGSRPAGVALEVSGNLRAPGGAGTTSSGSGGSGGNLYFSNCAGPSSSADFLGYASIALGGGAADPSGGASGGASAGGGGQFELFAGQQSETARRLYLHVPIAASGGDGYFAGQGGSFSVNLSTEIEAAALPAEIPSLVIAGTHRFDGGKSGQSGGGYGGGVSARALGSIDVPGSLSVSAVTTESDGDIGGGGIALRSVLGALSVAGELHSDGAEGLLYNGGSGGCISLEGRSVSLTGPASAKGGKAKDGSSTPGGDGGTIGYVSHDAPAEVDAALLDVRGGAGTPAGTEGNAGPDLPECTFRD